MMPFFLDIWGCIPEISKNCIDMTNASSTYLGATIGVIVGSITEQQDTILARIERLEEKHSEILKKLADFDDKHENSFDAIQELDKKIDVLLKKDNDFK